MILWQLYLSEWYENGFSWLLMIAGTIATNTLIHLGFLPVQTFVMPLILSIFGYAMLCGMPITKERKNHTIFIKKSLPIPGYKHLLIKMLWLITSYILYMVFWYTINLKALLAANFTFLLDSGNLLLDVLLLLILPFLGIVSLQFSYLVSSYVPKFRSLINVWVFILLLYLIVKIVPIISKVFTFLPDLPIPIGVGFHFKSSFLAAILAISIALLFINGKLWDNEPSI